MAVGWLSSVVAIARADLRQRTQSRRLLVVLVIVAYVGYQLNVGTFELLYQDTVDGETVDYRGEPTAPYVGLTTGLLGATILLFFGYYMLGNSLKRDRSTGFDELRASTPTSDRTYLIGKWLSHVTLATILLLTLAVAALVNHAVHGVGTTDPVWIVGAVLLIGIPMGAFVAGVTLVFQSTDRLRGTAGNVLYFFGAMMIVTSIAPAFSSDSGGTASISPWIRAIDSIGLVAAGEMTIDALLAVAPSYDGPPVGNYGAGADTAETVLFTWDGGAWPTWFYANRAGLALCGLGLTLAATLPYDRYAGGDDSPNRTVTARVGQFVPFFGEDHADTTNDESDANSIVTTNVSLTPVTDRSAGGFSRLLLQECRLLIRGRAWWWYVGAAVIIAVGLSGSAPTDVIVPAAAIWPLFLWSGLGYRPVQHRIMPFIHSSRRPSHQLLAEWSAGVVVAAVFLGVALWPAVLEAGLSGVVVFAGAVLFVPSVAQALGLWSGTQRVFELSYLVLWYVGVLNGVAVLDFAGATTETAGTTTPLLFGAIGLLALGVSLTHRTLNT
ncbi:hypothetical protein G6M89_05305 [Natronolimnobius sp. AArcel1]|uniref:ABC transporter permease n=1 Tax=Natronolimnobius sp. AArcel1 TaxID=1679093 RepID=UPI0013EBD1C6|nr:ABC transporter permease [Natronolimnobius sp. AArcel1]NGM68430.1 hypothetical protein [Natronolimnobius sp. AArcel1]